MDPDANLKELLALASKLAEYNRDDPADDVWRMAELVDALDGWIKGGGFLPSRWVHK